MARIILHISLFLLSFTLLSQNKNKEISITVEINQIVNDKGIVSFSLYQEDGFLEQPIQKKEIKIVNGQASVIFENVEKGIYSIICFHDSNGNGRLDFSPNRMPLEDIGISTSVIMYGPPTFEQTKFVVSESMKMEIKF